MTPPPDPLPREGENLDSYAGSRAPRTPPVCEEAPPKMALGRPEPPVYGGRGGSPANRRGQGGDRKAPLGRGVGTESPQITV